MVERLNHSEYLEWVIQDFREAQSSSRGLEGLERMWMGSEEAQTGSVWGGGDQSRVLGGCRDLDEVLRGT